ncbi:hemolysin family protein [Persicirhabdus sediminis]|uniref:HlyC/CorC family transporter n=1 Tax=Persicirhabdus sediminis TaxID=454144 RepID=A0A8J7MFR9_9BACT|nr:hemolysin family protein [Persicirhabdus sediminis]MBK1791956.1 HlyC/CorC family transporter [Persicirhabdus sediminis]
MHESTTIVAAESCVSDCLSALPPSALAIPRDLFTGELAWYTAGVAVLLFLNALFVAAEYAIVKVRPAQLKSQLDERTGPTKRIRAALAIADNLSEYQLVCQWGITLSSLALGFMGQPFATSFLAPIFSDFAIFGGMGIYVVALIASFMCLAVLHVVLGELIPRTIGIRFAQPTALWLARPLLAFAWFSTKVIKPLQWAADVILKYILRIEPVSESDLAHSAEELAELVAESGKQDEVTDTEREILINALELNDLSVKDVMTPRSEVIVLDVDAPFQENIETATRSKHTRFPIVKGHLDRALGLIHIKDILKLVSAEDPDLMSIKRELKVVPETMRLDGLLQFFLKEHAHLAMVVDEFGDPVGLVFLDNVIEELVGDIHDEFDNESVSFRRITEGEFVCEGGLTLNELSGLEPELTLESGEVSTVGGYITRQMGRIPKPGESLIVSGYEAKVTNTNGRRVGVVHFRRLSPLEVEPQSAA